MDMDNDDCGAVTQVDEFCALFAALIGGKITKAEFRAAAQRLGYDEAGLKSIVRRIRRQRPTRN